MLTDGLMSHPRRLDGLWERGLLQFGRILRPALYTDREDAQLEDLLGRALYRELVTGAYGLEESAVLGEELGSDSAGASWPRSRRTSRRCRRGRRASTASRPAAYLFENTATLRATLPDLEPGPRPLREALPRPAQPLGAVTVASSQ